MSTKKGFELNDATVSFFVYGTLKRNECRERCWPAKPLRIQDAFVRGLLFDLGPYPGMTAGDGWVRGEVWTYSQRDVPRVTEVLDEIEDFEQPGVPNMYERVWTDWFESINAAPSGRAQTYHYVMIDDLRGLSPIQPLADEAACWTEH